MPLTERQWTEFALHLQAGLAKVAPDWANRNEHDPGITVLEVLSYALTELQIGNAPPDDRTRELALAVADRARSLAARSDPYRNYRFRVSWDGRYVAGISKVSALKRTTQVVELREGGDTSTRKLPGSTRYEAVTLERGITLDREFEAWANPGQGVIAGSESVVPKNVTIEVLDETGRLALTYEVSRCWVSQYQALPELDAGRGAVLIESLTLENDGWQRVDTG